MAPAAAPAMLSAAAAVPSTDEINKETIRDPEIVDVEGATMLVPEGWKREGELVWVPQFSDPGQSTHEGL
jgi:hypothetical protein